MKTRTSIFPFTPGKGAVTEYHVMIRVTDPSLDYISQLEAVLQAAAEASKGFVVRFRRFFLSDAANQSPLLAQRLAGLPPVPTSVVGQAPLDGTRIALWLYCSDPAESPYKHRWDASLVSPGEDSCAQMDGIFRELERQLAEEGLSVARDTIRTWIFSRDVDTRYAGVVKGRKDYFETIGLTEATHYIASTGIEGNPPDPHRIVEMDAYSIGGLQPGQVRHLYALDHLSRTSEYGVTFERGTAVIYGDRRHVFISGTASIDAQGKVVHPGDVAAQTGRMLENISALLAEAGAKLRDIAMAVVYLRDPADYACVKQCLAASCPALNAVYVHAPVCRPAWLVEMECIALTPEGDPAFPAF